jgi:hypothetical protein
MNAVDRDPRVAPDEPAGARAGGPATGSLSRRLKAFAAALDAAGWEYLARRGVDPDEKYRLLIEECPVHGPGCARVTFGMLREHVEWTRADPAEAAAAMLGTMLPPARAGCTALAGGSV